MNLRLTSIPDDYPYHGPLDFSSKAMRTLFEFGATCAQSGKLWNTVDESLVAAMRTPARTPGATPPCPH